MSYKNIIGFCLLGSLILWMVADAFHDAFKSFGWWALVITPTYFLGIVAFWCLIAWLLED